MKRESTLNSEGLIKISPSTIINHYYPFDGDIPEDILIRAGAVGNCIHEAIENHLSQSENINLDEIIKNKDNELIENNSLFLTDKNKYNIHLLWNNFKNNEHLLPKLNGSFWLEKYVDNLDKIHGYIDYVDDKVIIDWKTNSSMGKKEIEKYTLQMNLYRWMIYQTEFKLIDELKLVHITRQEPMTPTFKPRKPEQLLKVIDIELMDFDHLEKIINEVFEWKNKLGAKNE